MKYTFKNLKNFFKNEKLVFMLVIICSMLSSMVLYFSYGLIHDFSIQKKVGESKAYELNIQYKGLADARKSGDPDYINLQRGYKYLTFGDLKEILSGLDDRVYTNAENMATMILYDDSSAVINFDEEGGMSVSNVAFSELRYVYDKETGYFSMSPLMEKMLNPYSHQYSIKDGSGFINEDFIDGNPKALVSAGIFNSLYVKGKEKNEMGYNFEYDGEFQDVEDPTITINGNTFDIIGISDASPVAFPISALSDDTVINTFFPNLVTIVYKLPVTHDQYTRAINYIEENYHDILSVREIEFVQEDTT